MKTKIRKALPGITEIALLDEIAKEGIYRVFSEGDNIINVGDYITFAPLVLSGNIRVSRINEDGKEVFLYYLKQGDTCADTLQCCYTNKKSQINAIAEEETEVILVSILNVNSWSSKYKSWKEFVMLSFKEKFNQLLEALDSIAFQKVDERLLSYLKKKEEMSNDSQIQITHHEIARDLNTSREVISRLLKALESKGLVQLGRNSIKML
ncbi:CRP/FNR family transcriptional regulator [Balneicella halophila]|uniref:CRP/FNR family transcriptional regulator n=1 Tax=Balneicella halophila TaxID=1537566 RepID=A0A7L4UQV8_BALHA|nr:Crp/Fnr family transcriptional regulator [Balneicella halophila]PVX52133.1 CRP/FNR family transcriptional regulator [Balneicella halophila]